jgi:hypothetical protein
MKVLGLDFSSSPSSDKSRALSAKWMYLATCEVVGDRLDVVHLDRVNGAKAGDYSKVKEILRQPGAWVAGIDAPLGMPLECVEHFGWLRKSDQLQGWERYVDRAHALPSRAAFVATLRSWKNPARSVAGTATSVRKGRLVDAWIGAQSPMNTVRPPVALMFLEATRILRHEDVSILPVRRLRQPNGIVLEAYPKIVARRFIGSRPYKDRPGLSAARQEIIGGLLDARPEGVMRSVYGISVCIERRVAAQCVSDDAGDMIDSILCAVQAA